MLAALLLEAEEVELWDESSVAGSSTWRSLLLCTSSLSADFRFRHMILALWLLRTHFSGFPNMLCEKLVIGSWPRHQLMNVTLCFGDVFVIDVSKMMLRARVLHLSLVGQKRRKERKKKSYTRASRTRQIFKGYFHPRYWILKGNLTHNPKF